MIRPTDIEPRTLVARMLDPAGRREILAALEAERGVDLQLNHAYHTVARTADATPDELRRLVDALVAEDHERWLADFLPHPQMPEDVLLDLAERGICVGTLGHFVRPRRLLERMVALHAYPEAVLSLALQLYCDPGESLAAFAAHAHAHAGHEWMLRCLAEVDPHDDAKEEVYENLLGGSEDAAAVHARHLAHASRCDASRLSRFLTAHTHPRVLVLLLSTEIQDAAKRALVVRFAELRTDSLEIVQALALRRWVDEAAHAELTPGAAEALFAGGAPEVLLALARNPRTPREMLERLGVHGHTRLARSIRTSANATLVAGRAKRGGR